LSSLSGTEEDANYPFTQIKKDSLDYKVKKVLLIYRQTVADRDEYSLQKSFHTVENVNNSSIIVADNDTASSLHSSQNSCKSITSSKQNESFVPSTGNAPINNSLSCYAVKRKGITFPTIRIKPLAKKLDGNPIIILAPFAVLSKPLVTEQKPIISNDDLYFVTSTQNRGKSYDSGGDESTVETSNVTS
jgi:hypothetical protein